MHKPKQTRQPETRAARYADQAGNVYQIEKASNGKWVCARLNPGGNRKGVKTMGSHNKQDQAQFELDANAERNGWKAVKR